MIKKSINYKIDIYWVTYKEKTNHKSQKGITKAILFYKKENEKWKY